MILRWGSLSLGSWGSWLGLALILELLPNCFGRRLDTAPSEQSYWCYHCASPRKHEAESMLQAMDQLLALRKTFYPHDRVAPDCFRPFNYSALQRDVCRYPWCSQITFDDGNGLPLTIRGCAEKMMAIQDPQPSCSSLHQKLNIRECVCPAGERLCGQSSAASTLLPLLSTFILLILNPAALIAQAIGL